MLETVLEESPELAGVYVPSYLKQELFTKLETLRELFHHLVHTIQKQYKHGRELLNVLLIAGHS